ncbi:MAG: FAD-dependent oxidoreductase [Lachnospiraceae bacterium]|jgi:2,4-dienoyl-CoA reductase-like NADH-dependent reductase (Old Yellow Enzyme family)/thioredoxin reductase|nr:FAD-dependent oxidoreductase [Lachnospiraceae bacterium]
MNGTYEHLFSPLRVGTILLRNRIVAAPVTKYVYEQDPAETLELIAEKARGGAGLVILGSIAVNDTDAVIVNGKSGSLYGPFAAKYTEELSIIHQYGAKASAELMHCGMFADLMGTDLNPVGPQAMEVTLGDFQGYHGILRNPPAGSKTVIGLDKAGMEKVCDDFARSAAAAKKMGFDMIMLHFAHGWLPAQFLSPFFNHRTDEFGGSFENRIRFPMMIIDRVRKAVGPDYPIDMRIGAKEYVEGGLEPEEVTEFICRVEDRIDMVHISSGLDKFIDQTSYIESPSIHPHLINVRFAEMVKQHVRKIPVVTVAGITMPDEAEAILAEGKADAIALGRALIADPEWPNKARGGSAQSICPCIRCVSCYTVATEGPTQGCAVNPCYERELRLKTEERAVERKKKVVVIGGGPAGMRAAMEADRRGHSVILLEKENRLGGLLNVSNDDPMKIDMGNYKRYLIHEVEHSGIDLRLGCEATPELVKGLQPDEIIAAVGSEPVKPRIPGIDRPLVVDILAAHRKIRESCRNMVVIGGGPSGCELALTMAEQGTHVTIVEMADELAAAGNLLYKAALRIRMVEYRDRIDTMLKTSCSEILENGVLVSNASGEQKVIPADRVVCCVGMRDRKALAESFYGLAYDVSMIGDCMGARRINEASHEGYFAGHRI